MNRSANHDKPRGMDTISLDKAAEILPDLVKRALEGEEIEISTDAGKVRLAPVAVLGSRPGPGMLKGQLVVGPEFFEPLPKDELEAWNGSEKP